MSVLKNIYHPSLSYCARNIDVCDATGLSSNALYSCIINFLSLYCKSSYAVYYRRHCIVDEQVRVILHDNVEHRIDVLCVLNVYGDLTTYYDVQRKHVVIEPKTG